MNIPLISIIIPAYNAEKTIDRTIESIIKQTYQNWECIIINDGSTDNTVKHLEKTASKNNKIRFYNQSNNGLSVTRNKGLDYANGELVYFLDADDVLPEYSLKTLFEHLHIDSDFVSGVTLTKDTTSLKNLYCLDHFINYEPKISNQKKEILLKIVKEKYICIAPNNLYRKKFIDQHHLRFKEGIFHEDELWFFQTMYLAKQVSFCNTITYHYFINNSDSIMSNRGDKNVLDNLYVLDIMYNDYYLKEENQHIKNIIGYYITHFKMIIIGCLSSHISNLKKDTLDKVNNELKNKKIKRQQLLLERALEKSFNRFENISLSGVKMVLFDAKTTKNKIEKKLKKWYLKLIMLKNRLLL